MKNLFLILFAFRCWSESSRYSRLIMSVVSCLMLLEQEALKVGKNCWCCCYPRGTSIILNAELSRTEQREHFFVWSGHILSHILTAASILKAASLRSIRTVQNQLDFFIQNVVFLVPVCYSQRNRSLQNEK